MLVTSLDVVCGDGSDVAGSEELDKAVVDIPDELCDDALDVIEVPDDEEAGLIIVEVDAADEDEKVVGGLALVDSAEEIEEDTGIDVEEVEEETMLDVEIDVEDVEEETMLDVEIEEVIGVASIAKSVPDADCAWTTAACKWQHPHPSP